MPPARSTRPATNRLRLPENRGDVDPNSRGAGIGRRLQCGQHSQQILCRADKSRKLNRRQSRPPDWVTPITRQGVFRALAVPCRRAKSDQAAAVAAIWKTPFDTYQRPFWAERLRFLLGILGARTPAAGLTAVYRN